MKIEIKVVSDRMGNHLKVQLASEETSSHVADIDRAVEERTLWLPDGTRLGENEMGETLVIVPGEKLGYTLTGAYHVFGKYAAK